MNSLTPIPTMYNILVADDHPLFRDAISGVIRCQFVNSSVLEAEDLDSAMTIAQQNLDLDMILLDLNMPGMDGLNGLIQLRTHAPSIPVVIVSAEHDKNVVLKSITYGAVGFIVKSLARSAMTEALEQNFPWWKQKAERIISSGRNHQVIPVSETPSRASKLRRSQSPPAPDERMPHDWYWFLYGLLLRACGCG